MAAPGNGQSRARRAHGRHQQVPDPASWQGQSRACGRRRDRPAAPGQRWSRHARGPRDPDRAHQAQIKPTPPPERPASRQRHGSAPPARQDAIIVAAEPPPAVGVAARLQSHRGRAKRHKSRRPLHRRRPASPAASSGGDERWGGTGRGPAEVDFRVSPPCRLEEATQERGAGRGGYWY
jgi:hypothetical protein